eukprot:CAMPEP_0178831896 /NCGR_PEP_ID=MMETSP0746-20121128/9700_1 /TAXON_ID=913974 /ORGANISM="Nitzschia punctata, Strain CCMP561" /LENGTH=271 /DNA_ID=CAMNT_0020494159 /DNA_START=172 /DNA_END=987 /DNA_ORIENTATION=+
MSAVQPSKGDVVSFSSPIYGPKHETTVLVILNSPIVSRNGARNEWFDQLWESSDEQICADGGANRLYAYSKDYIPNRIRGDLDSLDPAVRTYYEERKVRVVEQDHCQDTNDLDKALQVYGNNGANSCRVVVYGAFGGRFDQEMASFAALYKWAPTFHWQMYLYSDETCAFLVPAGKQCEIRLPFYDTCNLQDDKAMQQTTGEGPTCGLIPLGCRCESITTSGLKWDLDGSIPTEFGGLVSTSNRVMKPVVEILASHPIVFTAELLTKSKEQ